MPIPTPSTAAPLAAVALAGLAGGARLPALARRRRACSELYDAARAYDATYLAARAQADSAPVPGRPGARRCCGRTSALAGQRRRASRPTCRRQPESDATARLRRRRSPAASRSSTAPTRRPSPRREALAGVALADLDDRRAGPDRARQPGLLRRARRPGHAGARRAPARRRSPSSSPRPSATSRSAPRPSPTRARRRPASTWRRRRRSPPTTTCVTKRIALDQLVGRSNVAPQAAGGAGGAAGCRTANVEEWVARADDEHPTVRQALVALRGRAARDREGARQAPADGRRGRPRSATAAASDQPGVARPRHTAASACSSTCRSTPAARSRTGSRRRWCSRRRRATTSRRRAAASPRPRARPTTALQSGAAQVKALEAAESSSQLALEATQLGYRVGVRVNVDVLNAQTPALHDPARPRQGALRRAAGDAAAAPGLRAS